MGFFAHLFEAEIGARIHAGLAEAGLFLAGGLFLAAAVLAFLYLPSVPLLARFKTAIVIACLWIASLCVFGEIEFRRRGALDASADLRRQIEAKDAEIAERQREAQAASDIAGRAKLRAADLEKQNGDLQNKLVDYDAELDKAQDACDLSDADLSALDRLRGTKRPAASYPPKPAGAAGHVRPNRTGARLQ